MENEPSLPGDIPVTWDGGESGCGHDELTGGDHCIASTQMNPTLQTQALTLTDPSLQTQSGGGSVDEVADVIIVIGRRLAGPAVVILRWPGISGMLPALGTLREVESLPSDLEPPQQTEECTAEMIGDMGGILTPEKQQMVLAYMNSQMAQNMWDESNFAPGINVGREETAGLAFPDLSMERLPTSNSTVCGAQIDYFGPTLFDSGAIFVHTQPMMRGEISTCEGTEGLTYGNRPSIRDVNWLIDRGLELGLIIDADGITVFTENYNPDDGLDSPEVHHKGDHEGDEDAKCGITR